MGLNIGDLRGLGAEGDWEGNKINFFTFHSTNRDRENSQFSIVYGNISTSMQR
jgi:hypothetical protein